MIFPIFVAHGLLGIFDELIFLSIAVIFLIFMGIVWVRSRAIQPDFDEENTDIITPKPQKEPSDDGDRFKLD